MPIILGAFAVLFLFISIRLLLNARPETIALLVKSILGAFAIVVIVILILSGRFTNVAVGLAALISLLPIFKNLLKKKTDKKVESILEDDVPSMTVEQAQELLGVTPYADAKDIIASHRELIHKIHPDQADSTYLKAQINRAKEILLDRLKSVENDIKVDEG